VRIGGGIDSRTSLTLTLLDRLRPCTHFLCANCHVEPVSVGFWQDLEWHLKDCPVCTTKATHADTLQREPIHAGQVTDGRDPFEGFGPVLTEPGLEVILTEESGSSEGVYEIPGSFPAVESADDGSYCQML